MGAHGGGDKVVQAALPLEALLRDRGWPLVAALDTNLLIDFTSLPHGVWLDDADVPIDQADRDEVVAAVRLVKSVGLGLVTLRVPPHFRDDSRSPLNSSRTEWRAHEVAVHRAVDEAISGEATIIGDEPAELARLPLEGQLKLDLEVDDVADKQDLDQIMVAGAGDLGCLAFITRDRHLIKRRDLPQVPVRCLPSTCLDVLLAIARSDPHAIGPAPDLAATFGLMSHRAEQGD